MYVFCTYASQCAYYMLLHTIFQSLIHCLPKPEPKSHTTMRTHLNCRCNQSQVQPGPGMNVSYSKAVRKFPYLLYFPLNFLINQAECVHNSDTYMPRFNALPILSIQLTRAKRCVSPSWNAYWKCSFASKIVSIEAHNFCCARVHWMMKQNRLWVMVWTWFS